MPRYVIERELPGAGELAAAQLVDISRRSCTVLADMAPTVQWEHSYVTDDKIYCIYLADNEQLVIEHARRGGFPADSVARVHCMIDPTTAE
jgi:hypothetical protein